MYSSRDLMPRRLENATTDLPQRAVPLSSSERRQRSLQMGVTMLERPSRLPSPPRAERRPKVSTVHGTTLVDDYAWLRAANWQEVMRDPSALDPKIRAYLNDENEYAKAALAHTE